LSVYTCGSEVDSDLSLIWHVSKSFNNVTMETKAL